MFPAQRPASPEMAESPSATIAGVPTPGPSARAVATDPAAADRHDRSHHHRPPDSRMHGNYLLLVEETPAGSFHA